MPVSPRVFLLCTLLMAAAVVVISLARPTSQADAQPATSLSFDIGASESCVSVDEGDEIVVELLISDAPAMSAWEATIAHDRRVIEITEQDTRVFLAQDPDANLFDASEPLPDNNGRHLLSIGKLGSSGESGSGVLSRITFKAVGEGVSLLDIPQRDLNSDGRTDEGAILSLAGGGPKIGDVNGDNFFDGEVHRASIAVETSCDAPTESPTDPPTAAPETPPGSSPAPGEDGGSETGQGTTPVATGQGASGGTPDSSSGEPGGQESGTAEPSGGPRGDNSDGQPGRGDGGGGLSFALWVIIGLAAGSLVTVGTVIVVATRRGAGGRYV